MDLFEYADTVRDTQRSAWNDVQAKLGVRQQEVLKTLRYAPATLCEIANRLHVPINSISGRVTELCRAGLVKDSGMRRINPESGKANIVWSALAN